MNAPLYNNAILKLAVGNPAAARLHDPMGSAERRSPVCGSRVIVDIAVGDDKRVSAIGMAVNACALGQASATLMARAVAGRTAGEIADARDSLAAWLGGAGAMPDWPGIDQLAPALPYTARHAAILLAFEAAAEAAARASDHS
ncbi:MAG: iron-sulfur cluster assembly scaffold protein [Pseudomonadota bacterium]|nr:iron-sulfur cluster assembly scaffold protein [Pseudomonadota bacterium]